MSDGYVGEIRMFAGNFAPRNWAFCDGQLIAVSQNESLFSLLGTIYGGDGRTTFALPDMRGRVPGHQGTGPGLTGRAIGHKFGQEHVGLSTNTLPAHSHRFMASTETGNEDSGAGNYVAGSATNGIYRAGVPTDAMSSQAVSQKGGSQSHDNIMPTATINYIICLCGTYPSRS